MIRFANPDYEYMSEYIFQKRKTLLGKYRNHLVQRIKELGEGGEIPSIAQKKWDSFLISDIFSILPGKRLVSAQSPLAIALLLVLWIKITALHDL